MHPDEIGGVEIYATPAQRPAEIAKLSFGLQPSAAIVFWTQQRLGLPKPNPMRP